MADLTRLLAMLEPAVRPGNLPGPTGRLLPRSDRPEAGLPLEQRSFESLLDEVREQAAARQTDDPSAAQESSESTSPARLTDPLAWLGRTDRIENASVRGIHSSGEAREPQQ